MQYVGVGLRLVAIIIDAVVFLVVAYVIALATGGTTGGGFALEGAPAFLSFLIYFLYFVILEKVLGGTLGKLILGLRVTQADGSPISWGQSVVRNILRIIDGLFVYLVGAILVWTSDKRQRLGDRLAGTVVVRKGSVAQTQQT